LHGAAASAEIARNPKRKPLLGTASRSSSHEGAVGFFSNDLNEQNAAKSNLNTAAVCKGVNLKVAS
jgi:hypothetical protein